MNACTTTPEPSSAGAARHTEPAVPAPRQRLADDVPSALRDLVAQGFTSTEAGNLGAYLLGLARTDDGWTIEQIERLLFVRHLVSHRSIRS